MKGYSDVVEKIIKWDAQNDCRGWRAFKHCVIILFIALIVAGMLIGIKKVNQEKYTQEEVDYYQGIALEVWEKGIKSVSEYGDIGVGVKNNNIIELTPNPSNKGSIIYTIENGKISNIEFKENLVYKVKATCTTATDVVLKGVKFTLIFLVVAYIILDIINRVLFKRKKK